MTAGPKRFSLRMAGRLWWSPLVVIGLAVDRGLRIRWLFTPAIVVLTACASTVAKLVIRRPRPGSGARVAPLGRLGAAAFPSTHTACAFAIASWLRGSRQGRWLHLVAIGIGYLRVCRRAHRYGDVVAGAALGYGIVWRIESGWSRLLTSPADGTEVSAREAPAVGGSEPRSDRAPVPRRRRSPAPAGRSARSRPHVRTRGAGFPRARLAAIVSSLAVR